MIQEELSDAQLYRYARHLVLNEIGEEGQLKLLKAKVIVIGAGGLGAPLLMYLAASGVGYISIVDHDEIELSNLQRQIIHSALSVGKNKACSAAQSLKALNPEPKLQVIEQEINEINAHGLLAQHDLVIDSSDNWETRLVVARTAEALHIPLLSGAIYQYDGQISLLRPYKDTPGLEDIFPTGPKEGGGRCEDVGVFAPACGIVGSYMASEALKTLLDIKPSLAGKMLMIDCLNLSQHIIEL